MDEARLFSMVCSDSTKSIDLKLVHRKFRTNVERNFFTVRVMESWNRLPREAECRTPGSIQGQAGCGSGQPSLVVGDPAHGRGDETR